MPAIQLSRSELDALRAYPWPGNVRELQHVIERATIMARGGRVDVGSLLGARAVEPAAAPAIGELIPLAKLKGLEEASIRAALARTRGRIYGAGGAAELLGAKASTLASRMKALGIAKEEFLRAPPT